MSKVLEVSPEGGAPDAANPASPGLEVPRSRNAPEKESRRRRAEGKRPRGSKKSKGPWKKLLWVKQSYPDNYTDEATFLDHLQRNPRLQPYEFWPLVAASTVIVQHVCAVLIFVSCFAAIIQGRISPVAVVTTSSVCTVLGWVCWDLWASRTHGEDDQRSEGASDRLEHPYESAESPAMRFPKQTTNASTSSADASAVSEITPGTSHYNRRRVVTVKSAVLIYCALLGLSPILKSLTKSTTSDSIWAISTWLLIINVFFFDYSGGVEIKFPAPLSTNAGIMASTVLASRLTSTTHVFSLLLFAIEVFGLFPVFRRYLRHVSWLADALLTACLTLGAGFGLGVTVTGGGWQAAMVGTLLGVLGVSAMMALCALWLIGLQKYKNEIHGPWDPARPVMRTKWD